MMAERNASLCLRGVLALSLAVLVAGSTQSPQDVAAAITKELVHADPPPPIDCDLCKVIIKLAANAIRSNTSKELIEIEAIQYCINHHIEVPEVCEGVVKEFAVEIIYVFTQKYLINDDQAICTFLGSCAGSAASATPTEVVKAQRPLHIKGKPSLPRRWHRDDADVGSFVQVTDVHFDPEYSPGSTTDCGTPQCCRAKYGPGNTSAGTAAGPFGEYVCDTPYVVVENLMQQIKSLKTDFVLWTGDDPPHNIWEQSRAYNLGAATNVTANMKTLGVKVYPCIGNHESFPVNQFEGPGYDSWLYTALGDMWGPWLNDSTALAKLKYGGFYSTMMGPKWRLIALNTQLGMSGNFWLLLNDTDPGGQLAWFRNEMSQAKANGETVWIIGHIPTGCGNMMDPYGQNMHAIVEDYADIITGIFMGHTHHDSFEVYYDEATHSHPLAVAYVASSVTPYTDLNPSYRVYYYNRTTKQILNYQQYYVDLPKANKENKITWELGYDAQSAYGLTQFTPNDFQDLIARLKANTTLFNEYYINYYAQHDMGGCIGHCAKYRLCQLVSTTSTQLSQCVNQADLLLSELKKAKAKC